MYLFILETIGTQELILIGLVALIIFGPRKLPEMARKAGKMIRELKSVSNDFRATWEREVNFEETKISETVKRENPKSPVENEKIAGIPPELNLEEENKILPEIKEVSGEDLKKLLDKNNKKIPEGGEKPFSEKSEWF